MTTAAARRKKNQWNGGVLLLEVAIVVPASRIPRPLLLRSDQVIE